ncbi:ATP-binding protein [Carboxylicivirga sediminis]|uniref:ATP-binding protein n=1 Tax=Carboxylicivirga sediminis TaxID=2006564 RepID=A0A941IYN0_9BACT|nr:ATP-binding protein [Carboxylicivirga sediminis]MBR8536669.1 ATP-binding protein [Carboxylicivirga sediminis]
MKKKTIEIVKWQLICISAISLLIFPFLSALFQYEFSAHSISFFPTLQSTYTTIFIPNDIEGVVLLSLTIFLGITNGLLIARRQLRKGICKLDAEEIHRLITEGENEEVEFKSSLRYDYHQVKSNKNLEHEVLKAICGFLNAEGGKLLIGVSDYGEILGLSNDYWTLKKMNKDGFEQRLILIISNTIGKKYCKQVHITFAHVDDKEICIIHIEKSKQPAFLKENNRTIFYLRTGNLTNPLTTKEAVEYLQNN